MTAPLTSEALAKALAEFQRRNGYHRPEIEELLTEFGELVLATARAAHQQVTAERDEAREERDALRQAAGFKPGPFETALSREVILGDIAGMRPAMVQARRAEARAQSDADLWTMRMLEEWPGDTLLLRLWRQRQEATKAKRDAEASLATATSELARLRAEGEAKDRRIAELSETWTDEAGTVWSPPTAWAYAQACAALRKHRAEGEKLRRELSSYRVAVAEVLHDHMSAQCSLTGASQTEVAQHAARSIRRCISDRTALARAATAREGA